jgi:acetolactate synthase-1/2/3 large subunit
MKAAELFVKCLENEGVEYVFGVPGEENVDIMDALLESPIKFITTRHEQGAAFMADVYGTLTCKAGVCLSTLGPGATNLITGVADADMDRAPVVAIAGEGATTRMHKESHQILDLVNMFEPITKYATQFANRSACFIDFPENIAAAEIVGKRPIEVQKAYTSTPPELKIAQAAHIISQAKCPIILAGNSVIGASASNSLAAFAETLQIPVATTFMAKGAIPCSHELSLRTIGLKAKDWVSFGFERTDVVICVGYDMVEYHPEQWNPDGTKGIVHIDVSPAEVDEHYILRVGVLGDLGEALRAICRQAKPQAGYSLRRLREAIVQEMAEFACDDSFPIKPQRIVSDLRHALAPDDIVISDVGAHKMWMGRMYQAERPNTCIISNGFASMGIAVPGAVAAKLAYPDRKVVAVSGDAGFMMNSQEIETALRVGTPMVVLIWNDSEYGLITWHQLRRFGRPSHIGFNNPDFVKYAESFGAKGYRIERAGDLVPTLKQALADNTVAIIDCPVDYSENMKLTEKLSKLKSPL